MPGTWREFFRQSSVIKLPEIYTVSHCNPNSAHHENKSFVKLINHNVNSENLIWQDWEGQGEWWEGGRGRGEDGGTRRVVGGGTERINT